MKLMYKFSFKMFYLFFLVLYFRICGGEKDELGYELNIGNAVDLFANYGDLFQVAQVASYDYDYEEAIRRRSNIVTFSEKNLRVFVNVSSKTSSSRNGINGMEVELCETFDDLMNTYFKNFYIEGTVAPWKAFFSVWREEEIMSTFGIDYGRKNEGTYDNCCYVLVKIANKETTVQLDNLQNVVVKEYVTRAIEDLNATDPSEIRRFMKSYGTHYIDSYTTGNFIYQVFKYKRTEFNRLRHYIRERTRNPSTPDNLRYYFSSYNLKQVGDIRVASGNKTVESWAQWNLRDSQYLYSRPSLLRLHSNLNLVYQLNDLLDDKALVGLSLKTLKPIFGDRYKLNKYLEVLENDLKLWEVNSN